MAVCTNCAAEIGLHEFCAVCGAPAPRSEPVHVPTVVEQRSREAVQLHVAPMWERLLAGGIDGAVVGAYGVLVGFPVLLLFQLGPGRSLYDAGGVVGIAVRVGIALVLLAGPVTYSALMEGAGGQTLGKRSLKLQVVRYPGGRRIDQGTAWRRAVYRLVSLTVGALGLVVAGRDPLRRTWHDVWCGTVVIDTEPPRGATAPKAY